MKRNKNAPTVGQTEQGALSKKHTNKATPNSPVRQQTIKAYQQNTADMAELYAYLCSPVMVSVNTSEARRAITGFINSWQAWRAASDPDEAKSYLDKAAANANAIKRHSAHINIGGMK